MLYQFTLEQELYIVKKLSDALEELLKSINANDYYYYGKISALYEIACTFSEDNYEKARKMFEIAKDAFFGGIK